MNSNQKGKRGERQWRDELRAAGYEARRGQQFSGSPDSPDVVCKDLPFHWEVKLVERLNLEAACEQAQSECGTNIPAVAHRRNHGPWRVTVDADTFFRAIRGDFAK